LCQLLQLPSAYHEAAQRAADQFPLVAPLELVRRMRVGDPRDPLLRQVLPIEAESKPVEGFQQDPVGDRAAVTQPGLLQKYAHRALLTATPTCAVHCRYCFRRHFDYRAVPRSLADWQPALDQLTRDEQLREIVLSGGDPLVLTDQRLGELVARLGEIRHLRRLRIHSRLPVVIPQRVTSSLVRILNSTHMTPVVVIHANHPAELDATVAQAVDQLLRAGMMVLNQSVLLRGVNDSVSTLVELSERLIELRVTPYYLHQLDQVDGAAHFLVPIETGRQLVAELRARLPGYAVPRYVREQAGGLHKTPLA
jgi:EF-P beta-lysylation protein EpmB